MEIIEIAENGDWVAVFYEFKSSIPGVESNMATEWFRVEDGKIKESLLIYDASEWRKVYAKMSK
ncbi:MAG: nuclear transport factor 2 family protein [Bacteroidota bacterium]